jgi:UDP-N-acetylglucosamine 3-dehydrogenase
MSSKKTKNPNIHPKSKKVLKVAVVGVGSMGRHHARNYSKMKGVQLVGICDINQKIGREIAKLYNTRFYSNYLKLIDKEKLDAISIAVPTSFHKNIALDFIENNISVLIEKPMAANPVEARKIAKKANDKKVTLAIGHIERFNPAILKLKELVKNQRLGEILSIVVKRVGLFPPQIKDVNVVTDIAVHDLDIVTNLIGKLPSSVFARGYGSLTNGREDHAEIFLDYGKFGCFIQSNWITPIKIRTLSITGTKGYAELDYINQKLTLYKSNYNLSPHKGFKEFLVKFGKPEKASLHIRKKEPLRLELENFINSISTKSPPLVSADDGIKILLLADAVNKSIRQHKVIKLTKDGKTK